MLDEFTDYYAEIIVHERDLTLMKPTSSDYLFKIRFRMLAYRANEIIRQLFPFRDEYIKAETETMIANEKAKQQYNDALIELAEMPRRGRPSARKLELAAFIAEYEASQYQESENNQPRPVGRPKKIQLTPEHEASLKELSDRIDDFKGAKFASGHNPENCTDGQVKKLQLIENNYPDLYRFISDAAFCVQRLINM